MRRRTGRSASAEPSRVLRNLGVAVLLVIVLGALLGALWWLVAPVARTDVVRGGVYLSGHQELQVTQDGLFAVITGGTGVLAAVLMSLRPPRRPAVGAAVAPLLAVLVALVAWRVGVLLGAPSLAEQLRAGVRHPVTPLQLHAYGVLFAGAFLYALTRFLAALFSSEP